MQTLPERSTNLKWSFIIFLILTAVFMIWMKNFLYPLTSSDIVQFEMAKTPDKANALIERWQAEGKFALLKPSIYVDYIFILFYTITIATGCRYFSSISGTSLLAVTGRFFALLPFLAGIFDVVENLSMTRVLEEGVTMNLVSLVHKMAISKFSIILVTLFFAAICLVSWLAKLLSGKQKQSNVNENFFQLRN